MASTSSYDRPAEGEKTGAGWVMFAGIMLLIAGVLNVIYGIAAIDNSKFFVHATETQYILSGLNTWGWVTLILGALEIVAAFSIWAGGQFGRWFGPRKGCRVTSYRQRYFEAIKDQPAALF